jgi:hypothetical protein
MWFTTTGCMDTPDWHELKYTRKKPSEKDVIGVWVPTEKSLRDMVKRGKYVIHVHRFTRLSFEDSRLL